MAWFRKEKKPRKPQRERLEIPPDAWEKCEACGHTDIREKFIRNSNVCPSCDYHRRLRAAEYCGLLLDEGWQELETDLRSMPGGVANTTHGEGVVRGIGYGVGIKNAGMTVNKAQLEELLAKMPEVVRGYGHIKEGNVASVRKRQEELLASFRSPSPSSTRRAESNRPFCSWSKT